MRHVLVITLRFFGRMITDFTVTVREDKWDWAAVPAIIAWFVSRNVLKADTWNAIGPIVWGASLIVAHHAYAAARDVIREIETERSAVRELQSPILDSSGNPTVTVIEPETPSYFRVTAYGDAVVLAVLCIFASYFVWEKAKASDEPTLASLMKEGRVEFMLDRDSTIKNGTFFVVLDGKHSMKELGAFRALLQVTVPTEERLDHLWFSIAYPKLYDNLRIGGRLPPFSVQSSVWYDNPVEVLQDMTFGQSKDDNATSIRTNEYISDQGPVKTLRDFNGDSFALYVTKALLSHIRYVGFRVNDYALFAFPRRCVTPTSVDPIDDSHWPTPLNAQERESLVQLARSSYKPPEFSLKTWQWNFDQATPLKWNVARTAKAWWEPDVCPP
jgi:hypothetical protein